MTDTTTTDTTTTTTDTTTGTDVSALVDTYFEMWRATDPAQRAELVARAFAVDGRHVDPAADVAGRDQLAAMLEGVHATYPGFSIERVSAIDQHGAQVRFAWTMSAADGTPLVAGTDVGELTDDGRLARIASFWGDLPAR
jgi:hypothetical protein